MAVPSRREHTWASKMETPIGHHAIVRLDTDAGMSGWGEAPAIATWGGAHGRHYGETPETVRHFVESVPGAGDARRRPGRDRGRPSAHGQGREREPVRQGGGRHRLPRPRRQGTGRARLDAARRTVARRHRGRRTRSGSWRSTGASPRPSRPSPRVCCTIKCKTGLDPERDVELVRRLRETLGDDVRIRVDGNEGYRTVTEAVETTRRQEEYGIFALRAARGGGRRARAGGRADRRAGDGRRVGLDGARHPGVARAAAPQSAFPAT